MRTSNGHGGEPTGCRYGLPRRVPVGVVNCSPDFAPPGLDRGRRRRGDRLASTWLQANGAEGVDAGGQGSTFAPTIRSTPRAAEWACSGCDVLPIAVAGHELVSIDTFRPEIMREADGARGQRPQRRRRHGRSRGVELAAEFDDGRRARSSTAPTLTTSPTSRATRSTPWSTTRPAPAPRRPLRAREHAACSTRHRLQAPRVGVGRPVRYQKHVYMGLDRLRIFDLPALHPASVEGHRPARRAARHRAGPPTRVRPGPRP